MSRTTLIQDARRFSMAWRLWFWVLMIVNLFGPLFYIKTLEAQFTLGAYLLSTFVIVGLHRRFGWVRLLGVSHFPWIALLPWLVVRYLETSPGGWYGAWIMTVIVVDSICIMIDVVDITRFVAGERSPIVGV